MVRSRVIWLTGVLFAALNFTVTVALVLVTAETSDVPEWGIPAAACLTTFPLIEMYEWLLDRPGPPIIIQVAVPILIGTLIYGAIGAAVGWGIDRMQRKARNDIVR